MSVGHTGSPTCLCRTCHHQRRVTCLLTQGDHPDHRVPECPSFVSPEVGTEATCRTCRRRIVYSADVDRGHGLLPRTGWSDEFPVDALVCFRAIDYTHVPTDMPDSA